MRRIESLTFLRFIAALIVVMFHFGTNLSFILFFHTSSIVKSVECRVLPQAPVNLTCSHLLFSTITLLQLPSWHIGRICLHKAYGMVQQNWLLAIYRINGNSFCKLYFSSAP